MRAKPAQAFPRSAPQTQNFRCILAAYGGIFVAGSIGWGMVADGYRPDRFDIIGALVCLAGMAVIMYAPRGNFAVAAPGLFPLLSGHFSLVVGAVQRLGEGTAEQKRALVELDDAVHVGVLLLTELGYGSNVVEMHTEARWDRELRRFTLHTPGLLQDRPSA